MHDILMYRRILFPEKVGNAQSAFFFHTEGLDTGLVVVCLFIVDLQRIVTRRGHATPTSITSPPMYTSPGRPVIQNELLLLVSLQITDIAGDIYKANYYDRRMD